MHIVHVIELKNGVISRLDSFIAHNSQYLNAIAEKAKELALRLARENGFEGDDDEFLHKGNWDDHNGYEVIMRWSNVIHD